MRTIFILMLWALAVPCWGEPARAQEVTVVRAGQEEPVTDETRARRVPLSEPAIAYDADNQVALAGRLRTAALAGTPDAPVRNARFVVENRSSNFYTYVSGWAIFYDAQGVRCGDGLWPLEVFAPGEAAEVDVPGLRLTCTPATWRIVATTLLTRAYDMAKERAGQTAPAAAGGGGTAATPPIPPLEININGRTIPLQPGNPLEITVGKERMRIVVNPAP